MVRSSGVDVGMGVGGATNAVRSGAGGDAFALDPLTRNSVMIPASSRRLLELCDALSQDGHSSPVQRPAAVQRAVRNASSRMSNLGLALFSARLLEIY